MLEGLSVARAGPEDFEDAAAFYRSVDRDLDRVASCDTILLARLAGDVVGAVALCFAERHLVLRTMVVREGLRGSGIGGALLDRCVEEIAARSCWLLGFGDLIAFYSRVGFAVVPEEEAPGPLRRRLAAYREHEPPGHSDSRGGFVVMRRPAADEA